MSKSDKEDVNAKVDKDIDEGEEETVIEKPRSKKHIRSPAQMASFEKAREKRHEAMKTRNKPIVVEEPIKKIEKKMKKVMIEESDSEDKFYAAYQCVVWRVII